MLHKSIARFSICQCTWAEVAYSGYVPVRLPAKDGSAVLLFDIWSNQLPLACERAWAEDAVEAAPPARGSGEP